MADVIAFPSPERPCPRLHIWRAGDGWELHHESSHVDSWALLDRLHSREDALSAAQKALGLHLGAQMGEVAP